MKNSNKAHFWAHSIIGPKSGIKPHTPSSLSVGKLGPHVSKTQNTSESSCYLIELTLKKKKSSVEVWSNIVKRVPFAWTPFPADVEAWTEAIIEFSSVFWSSIPICLLVVPSRPVTLLRATVWPPLLLKEVIHSRSLAMSLRMRIRSFTMSLTSLTLKCNLLQKESISIL